MKKAVFTIFMVIQVTCLLSQADTLSYNIYQDFGRLGIGNESPKHLVDLKFFATNGIERNLLKLNNLSNGDASYTGMILKTGDSTYQSVIQDYGVNYSASTHYDFGGFLNLSNNNKGLMLHANSADGMIKFYTGHDEVAGAGIERLRIDANGNVGIGIMQPSSLLALQSYASSGNERNLLTIKNSSNSSSSYTGMILKTGDSPYQSVIQDYGVNYSASTHYDFGGFLNLSNNNKGLMLHANSADGIIKFYTGHDEVAGAGIERMRIDSTGNIGVGTKNPKAKLEISEGDVYISDIEKGIIMKSPDGQCWRGVLDNTGNLSFSVIACPEQKNSQSIRSEKSAGMVNVYPNPTENELYIELLNDELIKSNYSVYTINGQLLNTGIINTTREVLNIAFLEKGVFILEIHDVHGNKIKAEKFIKK